MTKIIQIDHITTYLYDRPVSLSPQTVYLKPSVNSRLPVCNYSFQTTPKNTRTVWIEDDYQNQKAIVCVDEKVTQFTIETSFVSDLSEFRAPQIVLDPTIKQYPFIYHLPIQHRLSGFLQTEQVEEELENYLNEIQFLPRHDSFEFVQAVISKINYDILYLRRLEAGVQSAATTLKKRRGSCRDSTWLAVQVFRQLGIAARFVSGYLVQFKGDSETILEDNVDFHAWVEIYLPPTGWIGLDCTSGLLVGAGHIPVAVAANPYEVGPVQGLVDACESSLQVTMGVQILDQFPEKDSPLNSEAL